MADYSALFRVAPVDISAPRADFFTPLAQIANQFTQNRQLQQQDELRRLALQQQADERARGYGLEEQKVQLQREAAKRAEAEKTKPQFVDVLTPAGKITRQYDPTTRQFSDTPTQGLPTQPTVEAAPDVEGEGKLRKEFESVGKTYRDVRDAYSRVLSSKPDAAGDIALIFGYMRMLDPGSVVREGEFATAQNAAGIPDVIRNLYNRALSGQRLNSDQRGMFKGQAKALYEAAGTTYKARSKQYEGLASRYGFDPGRVIPDLGPEPQGSEARRVPAVGMVEDGYRFKGGNPAEPSSWERLP